MTQELTKLTKDELLERLEQLEKENQELKNSSDRVVSDRVLELMETGVNSIEDLSTALNITSKNVSSNLTKLRKELNKEGKTIVSLRIKDKTMLSIQKLETLGWS